MPSPAPLPQAVVSRPPATHGSPNSLSPTASSYLNASLNPNTPRNYNVLPTIFRGGRPIATSLTAIRARRFVNYTISSILCSLVFIQKEGIPLALENGIPIPQRMGPLLEAIFYLLAAFLLSINLPRGTQFCAPYLKATMLIAFGHGWLNQGWSRDNVPLIGVFGLIVGKFMAPKDEDDPHELPRPVQSPRARRRASRNASSRQNNEEDRWGSLFGIPLDVLHSVSGQQ